MVFNQPEVKTGQSVDSRKHGLVHPVLVESILQIPELPTDLSLIDFGSGDATSSRDLLTSLIMSEKKIKNLALIDADTGVFPDLITTVASEPLASLDTQVVQAHSRDVMAEFLAHYEACYDLALFQLVLHQINNDHEASYLMYLAHQALTPTGELLVVNLHPRYLRYLAENEPEKFALTDSANRILVGTYNFDSSGVASVYSRNVEIQLAMLLGIGFDLVKIAPIFTAAIADQKSRYRDLAEKEIPMFYLMQVRKNPANFISSTQGAVDQIKPHNDQWIIVTFLDGDEITIPSFSGWDKIKNGDKLILQETTRKEIEETILNYWIIGADEEISGGQLVIRK